MDRFEMPLADSSGTLRYTKLHNRCDTLPIGSIYSLSTLYVAPIGSALHCELP